MQAHSRDRETATPATSASSPPPADAGGSPAGSVAVGMLFLGLMFFILGFATWLNGSLVPFLKIVCDLNNFEALWVTSAFYIAYTLMALPSAGVLNRIGYKNGMTLGLGLMGTGALLFVPAAQTRQYGLFLAALFTLASGMTLMQTAINPYIVRLGARESAATRISIMGLFNKGAGIVVPLVFTSLMLAGIERFSEGELAALSPAARDAARGVLAQRLVFPYVCMAAGLFAIMVFIHFSKLRDIAPDADDDAHDGAAGDRHEVKRGGVLRFPQLVLGALALFAYVGVEVIAGDTIGLYGHELKVANFGVLTSYTMVCMVIGYLIGVAAIPRWLSQGRALLLSALLGLVLTVGVTLGSQQGVGLARVLLGWSGAPLVPDSVMCLALLGLGRYTAQGSALLIMAISGGAVLPLLYGRLSDAASPQGAYWLLLPCYAMIFWYAGWGHRLRVWGAGARDAA
jgi:FHS family L-fucose permease-like MFS transporter